MHECLLTTLPRCYHFQQHLSEDHIHKVKSAKITSWFRICSRGAPTVTMYSDLYKDPNSNLTYTISYSWKGTLWQRTSAIYKYPYDHKWRSLLICILVPVAPVLLMGRTNDRDKPRSQGLYCDWIEDLLVLANASTCASPSLPNVFIFHNNTFASVRGCNRCEIVFISWHSNPL